VAAAGCKEQSGQASVAHTLATTTTSSTAPKLPSFYQLSIITAANTTTTTTAAVKRPLAAWQAATDCSGEGRKTVSEWSRSILLQRRTKERCVF